MDVTASADSALRYATGGKTFRGSIVRPQTERRGRSPLARDHARKLVELGCIAVIADLYGDGFNPTSPDQVGPLVKDLIDHRDQGVAALAACVASLRREIPDGAPLICLGYSAGAMIALDYGRSGANIDGIIVCSALLKTAAASMETIAEIDAAGNDVRFELYTQTHHAFDNPDAGNDPSARLVYSESSAKRAVSAITSFVNEVFERSAR